MTFDGLPEFCGAYLIGTDKPILIKRGESGYWPGKADFNPYAFNEFRKITPQQVHAMVIGSMFGWTAPGANPANPTHKGLTMAQAMNAPTSKSGDYDPTCVFCEFGEPHEH